jgi:hypothetical protein
MFYFGPRRIEIGFTLIPNFTYNCWATSEIGLIHVEGHA